MKKQKTYMVKVLHEGNHWKFITWYDAEMRKERYMLITIEEE